MRQLLFTFLGIGVLAGIALGILAVSFDPYQTSMLVKLLFFSALGILGISLVGILYCGIRIIVHRFKK